MLRWLWVGLFCLAGWVSLFDEAFAQEADSRPALDLVAEAEQAQSGKDNAVSGKGASEDNSTSLTSLSTSSTETSGSTGSTGGAMPRQPILPYNGTFDTSIPIKLPPFHGIDPFLGQVVLR